ncbi:MFS transporter [Metapseudomonas furukawaii]|uniref:MFS transporter n=1 Tax=Metapseudomonas furukawaii TaxID=1149133 RepID=UPI00227A5760|nr:MFS transporter [Pseudomonas furukawaii]WAG81200.1 MFS transporter [Pseudomonas furukawaii]
MSTPQPAASSPTLQIVSIVFFTFISFLCVGLPIAVLPGYVHDDMGYGSVMAGVVISTQYLSTLLSRPMSGSLADRLGPKCAVIYGLASCGLSGVLTLLSTSLAQFPLASLALLLGGRVLLGIGQGLVGTGSISWGVGLVGAENMARVISFNGIASYGAVAIGAPLGVVMVDGLGLWSIGALIALLCAAALLLAWPKRPAPIVQGERLPFTNVFLRIAPNGTALALGSIGFGTLATFVTLYYADLGWSGAAWCLTAFGCAFIGARLLFVSSIKRLGGYRVAIICLAVESLGLFLLWAAPTPWLALAGAALTGFGLSLVYPALGVEAVSRIPAASRSSALGAYAVFFDLALGIAGPLMGAIAGGAGFAATFLVAALMAVAGVLLSLWLLRDESRT